MQGVSVGFSPASDVFQVTRAACQAEQVPPPCSAKSQLGKDLGHLFPCNNTVLNTAAL